MRRALWWVIAPIGVGAWLVLKATPEPDLRDAPPAAVPVAQIAPAAALDIVGSSAVRPSVRPAVSPTTIQPALASARKALYDAADIFDAVKQARVSGSPDEKGWAAELVRECSGYISKEQHTHRVADSIDSQQVEARRLAAFEELQKRCKGISGVPLADSRQVAAELEAAAKASTSDFHALTALRAGTRRGDTRWTPAESRLMAASLYSSDALIRREAFLVLWSSIDRNAPSGSERSEALLFALADQTINQPLSTFEQLAACAAVAMCGDSGPAPVAAATPDRLQNLYREAFERRLPPEAFLAIR